MASQEDTLSRLERQPPKVASKSRIDAADLSSNLPSHANHSEDAQIVDNKLLHLDDLSRRSACDRCRGMKMRCERPHRQYVSQLQQCRRCSQADVRCITTLEAERHDNNIDKRSQKSRKRYRQYPMKANSSSLLSVPHALDRRLDEQHHDEHNTPSFEHRPERIVTEMLRTRSPSMHAFSNSEDGMFPFQNIHDQCHEPRNMMDWDGSGAIFDLGDGQTRTVSVPPPNASAVVAISLPNPNPEADTFMEAMTASSATTVQSTAGATFSRTSQESHALFRTGLLPPLLSSPHHLPDAQTPPTEVRWAVMNKLMEFNTKVLHDLHDLRGPSRARGGGDDDDDDDKDKGVLMVKTLQYSDMILELLSNFTRPGGQAGPGESPGRTSLYSSSGPGSAAWCSGPGGSSSSTSGWGGEKVDTDLALLLLSCTTNLGRLYELLCADLTVHSGLHLEEALLSLRMEGLHTLDAETRVQVLVHISFLKFTKIQNELESIRRLGLLTETADKAFQVVLGNGRALCPGCPGLGTEQMVDQFRRYVMDKGHSSSSLSSSSSSSS